MFPGLAIDGQTVVWTHRRPENITPHLPVWLDLRTQRLIFQSGLVQALKNNGKMSNKHT